METRASSMGLRLDVINHDVIDQADRSEPGGGGNAHRPADNFHRRHAGSIDHFQIFDAKLRLLLQLLDSLAANLLNRRRAVPYQRAAACSA